MIEIKLSELQDEYVTGGDCGRHLKFLCNTIRRIVRNRNYGVSFDIDVTEQFREEWFKKVHGVFCSGAMYDYGGGYINEWNAIGNYSVGKFNEETCHGYGGKFNTTFGYREYRIWLLESVLRDKGNIVFEFWIETNRYDDN